MYLKNTAVLVQPGRKGARSNLCILRVSLIGGRYSVAVCMPDRRGTGSDRWKMEVGGWLVVGVVHAGKEVPGTKGTSIRYGTNSSYW